MKDNKIDFSVFKLRKGVLLSKFAFSLIALFLIGIAIAFNNLNMLGNDAVSVLMDGVRKLICRLTPISDVDGLAVAVNLLSVLSFMIVFVFKRKYINIGTIIYSVFLGSFTGLGVKVYYLFGLEVSSQSTVKILSNLCQGLGVDVPELMSQVVVSIFACLCLFAGIAIFIAINIGYDPFTGLAMLLSDFLRKPFKMTKVLLDLFFLVIGCILGGEVGFVTVVSALIGGPIINRFVLLLKKTNLKSFNT